MEQEPFRLSKHYCTRQHILDVHYWRPICDPWCWHLYSPLFPAIRWRYMTINMHDQRMTSTKQYSNIAALLPDKQSFLTFFRHPLWGFRILPFKFSPYLCEHFIHVSVLYSCDIWCSHRVIFALRIMFQFLWSDLPSVYGQPHLHQWVCDRGS